MWSTKIIKNAGIHQTSIVFGFGMDSKSQRFKWFVVKNASPRNMREAMHMKYH